MLVILLVMPIDTFTGVALLMTAHQPWPAYAAQHHAWGPGPLTDTHWGGAVMWVGGDTLMIVLLVAALLPWLARADRTRTRLRWVEQARRAHLPAAALTTDVDEDQAHLDAYNAWLARLSADGRPTPGGGGPSA